MVVVQLAAIHHHPGPEAVAAEEGVSPSRRPVCPAFAEGSRASRKVVENTAAGVDIGEPVTAADPDDDPLAYTLGGTDRRAFDIDAASGQLLTKVPLDYETQDTYVLTVGVRDSKDAEGKPDRRRDDSIRVTINLGNVDEDGYITLSAPTPVSVHPSRLP